MGRGSDGSKGQKNLKGESIWPHFPIWDSWIMMNFFLNFTWHLVGKKEYYASFLTIRHTFSGTHLAETLSPG